jgi:hypothetical protein
VAAAGDFGVDRRRDLFVAVGEAPDDGGVCVRGEGVDDRPPGLGVLGVGHGGKRRADVGVDRALVFNLRGERAANIEEYSTDGHCWSSARTG